MNKKTLVAAVLSTGLALPVAALACGGVASGKHMGDVVAVDSSAKTFTIRDAETRSPITFTANEEIVAAVAKSNDATVMVNFEETAEGGLRALGVTF